MISQQNLHEYISNAIPGLLSAQENSNDNSPYHVAGEMIRYTATMVLDNKMPEARECLTLAENVYNNGSDEVKNAVENVFVYSFSHTFFCDEEKRRRLIDILPSSLYSLYKKQVLSSHL